VIDQEHPPAAMVGEKRRALLEQPRLRNRDLAQRTVRRERHEIGVGREQQGIFVALLGGQLLASRQGFEILREAEVVLLDLRGAAKQPGAQPARQRGLADALRTGEQQGLGQPLLREHLLQRLRDVGVAPEWIEQISG
jgi:hypothetical protein